MTPSIVLVTRVSRFVGAHVAVLLAGEPLIERVLGVDTVAPRPTQRLLHEQIAR